MDNQQFLVNGRDQEHLVKALNLLCDLRGRNYKTPNEPIKGWKTDPKHGFILYWCILDGNREGINAFPVPVSVETVVPMIHSWINSEEGKAFKNENRWEDDLDHDGHNSRGWTLYVEDWGHVGDSSAAIGAVRPSWCWYGK